MGIPEISVVVPVRHAERTIARTVEALLDQCGELEAEVIAVVSAEDHPSREALRVFAGRPEVQVIEMPGRRSAPELRGEGVRAARGRLVAITEDHCQFSEGWLATMREILDQREVAAAGGPVENGRTGGVLDWAIYFSRYLGSMPPVGLGSVAGLPGNNACYRREVLERFRSLYRDGLWEHEFNRELVAYGYLLWQDPRLVVAHHKPYRFSPYLALRYRHARCFGGREPGGLGRVLAAPLVPVLLALRAVQTIRRKKRRQKEFLLSLPALLLCYLVWFWGELVGRVAGPGQSCSQTD
jgi:glycosyltransferase involved in cell wall biosynthesis